MQCFIEISSIRDLLCRKFAAVCRKITTSCIPLLKMSNLETLLLLLKILTFIIVYNIVLYELNSFDFTKFLSFFYNIN